MPKPIPPDPDAPVEEHRKFARQYLASRSNKVKPVNHPGNDKVPEDDDYRPADYDPEDV